MASTEIKRNNKDTYDLTSSINLQLSQLNVTSTSISNSNNSIAGFTDSMHTDLDDLKNYIENTSTGNIYENRVKNGLSAAYNEAISNYLSTDLTGYPYKSFSRLTNIYTRQNDIINNIKQLIHSDDYFLTDSTGDYNINILNNAVISYDNINRLMKITSDTVNKTVNVILNKTISNMRNNFLFSTTFQLTQNPSGSNNSKTIFSLANDVSSGSAAIAPRLYWEIVNDDTSFSSFTIKYGFIPETVVIDFTSEMSSLFNYDDFINLIIIVKDGKLTAQVHNYTTGDIFEKEIELFNLSNNLFNYMTYYLNFVSTSYYTSNLNVKETALYSWW